jgi:hypothetical protein
VVKKEALMMLSVTLPENWEDISAENPEGPPTYVRKVDPTGALQMSIQSVYKSGPIPNPTFNELIRLSEHVAKLQESEISDRYSGLCNIGTFGCVLGKSTELARIQIWTLSNGKDFVLATFLCIDPPPDEESEEAEKIVKAAGLS